MEIDWLISDVFFMYFYISKKKMLSILPPSGIRVFPSPRFLCRPTALYIFARAVGRQRAMHTENSGFASPTLGRHISTRFKNGSQMAE
jgi:hypothetical protein